MEWVAAAGDQLDLGPLAGGTQGDVLCNVCLQGGPPETVRVCVVVVPGWPAAGVSWTRWSTC